jgi:putative transcriptional regulator
MATSFGKRLIESAEQALAYAKGRASDGFVAHVPQSVDVRAIRACTGLSQVRFAARLDFTVDAVREHASTAEGIPSTRRWPISRAE